MIKFIGNVFREETKSFFGKKTVTEYYTEINGNLIPKQKLFAKLRLVKIYDRKGNLISDKLEENPHKNEGKETIKELSEMIPNSFI